jgi:hypothetical protein
MLELVAVALVIWMAYLAFMAVLGKGSAASSSSSSSFGTTGSSGGAAGGFATFADRYETIEEVQEHLRRAGLESSNLILGIDYTKSNEYNGRRTFGGKSLHELKGLQGPNPYERAIDILGRTLAPFDDDHLIPAYGFGDITTKDVGVFQFFPDARPCRGLEEALARYREITPSVQLSGPTSFAPVIYEAIRLVRETRSYHILIIVADGQVTSERETINAIVEASNYPLSIVVVGVGDGPWETMQEFDDGLPSRKFDNFQFVEFNKAMHGSHPETSFAIAALMEIPEQYQAIRKLGLL